MAKDEKVKAATVDKAPKMEPVYRILDQVTLWALDGKKMPKPKTQEELASGEKDEFQETRDVPESELRAKLKPDAYRHLMVLTCPVIHGKQEVPKGK